MLVFTAVVWLVLMGLYLFLAGTVDSVEITAGIVCASLGTALAVGLRRVAHRRLAFAPPPLRAILRPFGALLPETFAVAKQLLAPGDPTHRGRFVTQPFDPGQDDDPRSAGRRAIAVLGISLAPGGFVIRGEGTDTMTLHALPPKPASPDARWPA